MNASTTRTLIAEPSYWDEACRHLMKRDRVMKRLIPQFGQARLESRGDAFVTLARSIVGQQISVKAAQAVWGRFAALCQSITPARVLKLKVDDMRAAGLSARKVEYLVDLALHFSNGAVHTRQWSSMEDEAIIRELVDIRGIGRWTAERDDCIGTAVGEERIQIAYERGLADGVAGLQDFDRCLLQLDRLG